MTLNQAIKRHEEQAMIYTRNAISKKYYNEQASEEDERIAEEHRQEAEWLTELKELKEAKQMREDTDNED